MNLERLIKLSAATAVLVTFASGTQAERKQGDPDPGDEGGGGEESPPSDPQPSPVPRIPFYEVHNWHSGMCIDARGRNPAVTQRTCTGAVSQLWTKGATDSDYFTLKVADSGKCLEVESSSQADNALAVQSPCTGAYNQQWQLRTSGAQGYSFLVARHSGKGLTIMSESLVDGAQLVQYAVGDDGPDTLHASDWQFR